MLQAQRASNSRGFRLISGRAAFRFLPASLQHHGMTIALAVVGVTGLSVADLVEAPYIRAGLMVHIGLLVTVGGTIAAMSTRSRRTSAAETVDVAHDLRGPLVSLQTTLELLASDGFGTLPEQARNAALQAAATSGRAAELVDRTLGRAASELATAPLTTRATSLDDVLREAMDALDVQVRSTRATIEVASLPRVAGDPSALFRVFTNLLQNGLKYHRPDVPPQITVSVVLSEGWAEIAVADLGIGIAPAERSRVFERRYRTAAGLAHAGGAGLGLATVHRLVSEMGGTVWVDGTVPQGTTIRLRLPLA